MGSAQRRIGPFNLGWYGILSSIINGCNLIITQLIIPKLHFYFGFQSFYETVTIELIDPNKLLNPTMCKEKNMRSIEE